MEKDARGDTADEDFGVLWIDGSPLGIELIDDDVVALTLFLVTRIGEQDEIRLVTDAILGMSTRQTDCGEYINTGVDQEELGTY